jgi:hypothetical protein
MKKLSMAPIVIDLQRVSTGFKVKDEETVFVLKKTSQHPELNIQRKNPEFQINIPLKSASPNPAHMTSQQSPALQNQYIQIPRQSHHTVQKTLLTQTNSHGLDRNEQSGNSNIKQKQQQVQQTGVRQNKPELQTAQHHSVIPKVEAHDIPQPPPKVAEALNIETKFKVGLMALKPIIIPTSAIWFDFTSIHRIERESLPEFFSNSLTKTSASYKTLRNNIISLFYQDRDKYLSACFCLKSMV